MKGPTTRYLPTLCRSCLHRAVQTVLEATTRHAVEICHCALLYDRTAAVYVDEVVYKTAGQYHRQVSGNWQSFRMKEREIARYLGVSI